MFLVIICEKCCKITEISKKIKYSYYKNIYNLIIKEPSAHVSLGLQRLLNTYNFRYNFIKYKISTPWYHWAAKLVGTNARQVMYPKIALFIQTKAGQ